MKDQMCFGTQKNSSEAGKMGRLLILFVGLILSSKLRWYWNSTSLKDKYSSSLDIFDEMEVIRFCENKNGISHITTFTVNQAKICEKCEVEVPKECLPRTLRKLKQDKKNSLKEKSGGQS